MEAETTLLALNEWMEKRKIKHVSTLIAILKGIDERLNTINVKDDTYYDISPFKV